MSTISSDHTILIVENNQFNLELLLSILGRKGYRLTAAGNGEKAIQICEDLIPDLILMDVQMPGMDGFETAAKLMSNDRTKHIPILFTSTFSDTSNILRCFESGGVDYISKPFKKDELLARINTHLSLKNLREQLKTDRDNLSAILKNMLPGKVISSLKSGFLPKPESFENAAVLFTDFKNFSNLAQKIGSDKSVGHLNHIYFVFDEIIDAFGMERIKTIGDAYFAVGGINTTPIDIYLSPILAALKMQEFVHFYNSTLEDVQWELRIGLTVGSVTSGVIGYQKIAFDVWGDSVNLANRLENEAATGNVAVSESFYHKVKPYISISDKTVMTSVTWGPMNIYQCNGITEELPSEFLELYHKTEPRELLVHASSKKSILNKIFQLAGNHPSDTNL